MRAPGCKSFDFNAEADDHILRYQRCHVRAILRSNADTVERFESIGNKKDGTRRMVPKVQKLVVSDEIDVDIHRRHCGLLLAYSGRS